MIILFFEGGSQIRPVELSGPRLWFAFSSQIWCFSGHSNVVFSTVNKERIFVYFFGSINLKTLQNVNTSCYLSFKSHSFISNATHEVLYFDIVPVSPFSAVNKSAMQSSVLPFITSNMSLLKSSLFFSSISTQLYQTLKIMQCHIFERQPHRHLYMITTT